MIVLERKELRPMLVAKYPREKTYLLPVLHFIQEEFDFIPEWALQIVSWHLKVPASEVYGAATSYSDIKFFVDDKQTVKICSGLSCWYMGGKGIYDQLSSVLGDEVSIQITDCAFTCSMAPLVEVEGQWFSRATEKSVLSQIAKRSD